MMVSEKVTPEHLKGKAVIYVRQSTMDQVRWNRESQRRQYDLANQASEMGWKDVEVIDEDMGRSGSSAANRSGFQRMLASVCLKEVGAVFSLEASRLARNNRDWYQLIDMCGLVGTLIVDYDGVYDPRMMNDRLLLGLKGTMSEFELGLIRQRALEALHSMARRGQLFTTLPIGYVRTRDNRCDKDPDLRIQNAVGLVFRKFNELGSVRQALLWLRQGLVMIPAAEYDSAGRKTTWRLPVYNTLLKILGNPVYAGAYAYGRTASRTKVVDGRPVITRGHHQEPSHWEVLIKDHHEAYISWGEYEKNQRQIKENAAMKGAMTRGPARSGRSLIAGLLRCGRCGRKLRVAYSGIRGKVPRYACLGEAVTCGKGRCISFGGLAADWAIEWEILKVVQPSAIEAAVQASEAVISVCDERKKAVELAVKQAQYEAARARRQYDAVEPENRLVAGELERRWNEALARVGELESALRQIGHPGTVDTVQMREELLSLASDLPAVWNDPRGDMRLKKRIVRALVEEIVVDLDEGFVNMVIHWAGGRHSLLRVKRNHTGYHRYTTDRRIVDVVTQLAKVSSDTTMANVLNRLGYKTGKGQSWNRGRVSSLRNYNHIPVHSQQRQEQEGWLNLGQAAKSLGVSTMSVHRLLKERVLEGQQAMPYAPWIIHRDSLNRDGIQAAVQSIKHGRKRPLPARLGQKTMDLRLTS